MKKSLLLLCAAVCVGLVLSFGGCEPADPCEKGHTPVAVPGQAATCTETGLSEGSVCSVCGQVLTPQDVLPADPENHVSSHVDGACLPTPTEKGYSGDTVCDACEKVLVRGQNISNEDVVNRVASLAVYGYRNALPRSLASQLSAVQLFQVYRTAFMSRFTDDRVLTAAEICWMYDDGHTETDNIFGLSDEEYLAVIEARLSSFDPDNLPELGEHYRYLYSKEVLDGVMRELFGDTFSFKGLKWVLWTVEDRGLYARYDWNEEENGVVFETVTVGGIGEEMFFYSGVPVTFDETTCLCGVDIYENTFDEVLDRMLSEKVGHVTVRVYEQNGAYRLAEYIPD